MKPNQEIPKLKPTGTLKIHRTKRTIDGKTTKVIGIKKLKRIHKKKKTHSKKSKR